MATRLKTVKYSFPTLASLTNNTLTNMTQITINLPETGTKTFRSVVAHVTMDDIITATGGTITTKTLGLRLGAAGYTSVANANAVTNSAENLSLYWAQDFTSHFTTNWTGTSMTCDFQLQINQSTGTTLGMVNVCVTLDITYEYDDTSTTHIKTVMIPLDAPDGAIPTTATTYDTIPVLDTYLPETSKTYRNIHLVMVFNSNLNGSTTDRTLTINVGAATVTTGNYEAALASDRLHRYVWDLTSAYPSTAATQTFQLSMPAISNGNHPQVYLVVTYEFNASTTTSVMNSVQLPMDISSPMGTSAAIWQRASRELWIQEPATITTNRIAYYLYFNNIAAIAGLNVRIGTGSFVTKTDNTANLCGANAMMELNNTAFTLARGRNTLTFDVYTTDTADLGQNLSGFWLVNYTSGKATDGVGAHNHTVNYGIVQMGTGAAAQSTITTTMAPIIPETNYFITAIGLEATVMSTGNSMGSPKILIERLASGEGGLEWEIGYVDPIQTDPEVGWFPLWAQVRSLFNRWNGDFDSTRMNIESSRRFRFVSTGQSAAISPFFRMGWIITYHTITYTVSGNVTNSNGGTVTLSLHRQTSGERVRQTTRTGNGSYSFVWYDNTEPVYVDSHESDIYKDRSANGTAT